MGFAANFVDIYSYLNLENGNSLILTLATTLLSVYFVVQFLYTKNVSYLREQEQRDKMQIAQLQQRMHIIRTNSKMRSASGLSTMI